MTAPPTARRRSCGNIAKNTPLSGRFVKKTLGLRRAQSGIREAAGEYLYFLDSDDLIEPDALEQLYQTARQHEAELVICKIQISAARGQAGRSMPACCRSGIRSIPMIMISYGIIWSAIAISDAAPAGERCAFSAAALLGGWRVQYALCLLLHPHQRLPKHFFCAIAAGVASEGFSVSQTISLPLLRDYMAANGMIYDAAAEASSCLRRG